MPKEIERKFLLTSDAWRNLATASHGVTQGYLSRGKDATVRVRVKGDKGYITIKGDAPKDHPLDTPEFEYDIPADHAREMLLMCKGDLVTKTRYIVPHGGMTWEVDVFHGKNEGLVVAEIELPHADAPFDRPGWVGEEVTFEHKYKNAALSEKPFSEWKKNKLSGKKHPSP